MTNSIAIVLGLLIVAGIAADLTLFEGQNLVFLGKKFYDLLQWMAFWR
ncbi:hypothetical protein VK792_14670 [Mesobacterium sp. TK19101]|uniref:Glyceraldehyde-3-phosphate dehydrogenase n=1 Tax=Mesobacterium hydrothermale TaxID=3111907 RepID=A0ABU6HJ97_9RHOB|nr:hypothetical protein [Mesobacterium sp. TK19101]MEC3862534.1 hypothetical protein [Mesobacterium sp. TK19101]